jgi:hypothetical protein
MLDWLEALNKAGAGSEIVWIDLNASQKRWSSVEVLNRS